MWKTLFRLPQLLASQRGEVGDEGEETASLEEADAAETPDVPQTGDNEDGAIQGQEAKPAQEESFISPNELPDELKPHWKRMHRAYTKRLEEIKQVRDQAAVVERFYNDKDFAFQTLAQWAAQHGYTVSPAGVQQKAALPASSTSTVKAPPELVEAVKAQLPPELQWMAEAQANAYWAANQFALAPLQQQAQQRQQQQLSQEYDKLADELTQTAPGWEEHEADMMELLDFVQSPQLRHPKFGSKLGLLYNALTGNQAAIAETTNRMQRAVKNRSSSGIGGGRTASNLTDRIRKASSANEAWDIAAQAALAATSGGD